MAETNKVPSKVAPAPVDSTPAAPNQQAQVQNKRGGARAGAGRKPKSLTVAEAAAKAAVAKAAKIALAKAAKKIEDGKMEAIQEIPLAIAVRDARRRIGDSFPVILDALFTLMEGGKQVTRRWEMSALVQVDAWTEADANGKQVKFKKQLYPEALPDEMVLVSQQEVVYPPDSAVLQFLFNRLAGKPAEEKTNPLDEAVAGASEKMPTREELLLDVMELLWQRWETRSKPVLPEQDAKPEMKVDASASS